MVSRNWQLLHARRMFARTHTSPLGSLGPPFRLGRPSLRCLDGFFVTSSCAGGDSQCWARHDSGWHGFRSRRKTSPSTLSMLRSQLQDKEVLRQAIQTSAPVFSAAVPLADWSPPVPLRASADSLPISDRGTARCFRCAQHKASAQHSSTASEANTAPTIVPTGRASALVSVAAAPEIGAPLGVAVSDGVAAALGDEVAVKLADAVGD